MGGNATESVPQRADCYALSNFLVSMSDSSSTAILRNCRRLMAAEGVVILVEWVMPTSGDAVDPFAFWDAASMDLNMLAIDGSAGWRVRTAQEFRALLDAGGFRLSKIIPTTSSVSVIEALPV
jgi:hypothetical protein